MCIRDRYMGSLEVFWRELIQLYTCQPDNPILKRSGKLNQAFAKFTSDGLPFEIIDGDNIHIAGDFLTKAIQNVHQNILVVSIIGAQSTGKSTLLNFLFGCSFATSAGRCTKGIYGTLLDCSIPGYDGILILDTEGISSTIKQDPEYDRKIFLFCMAASNIVILLSLIHI
eukprot:TRINITY_DN4409_c0_g1_i1.p1 TRINITY_DN4409_c0_g1~~TRINITY_DN4409_c0_g1_i1.p1  ORF type:complete len:189 (-),score=18.90 TRINITY_DN4409_c0_g1_i1:60-569(-)